MITRMWEARVRTGELELFLTVAGEQLVPGIAAAAGNTGVELYRSHDTPDRAVLISHWTDEAALEGWAGAAWRDTDVESREVADHLERAAHVWHFVRVVPPC